eukprot:scaffold783_cov156-Skeletonema_marinoi.AAC.5
MIEWLEETDTDPQVVYMIDEFLPVRMSRTHPFALYQVIPTGWTAERWRWAKGLIQRLLGLTLTHRQWVSQCDGTL